jgi:hypothetical protein
VLICGPGSNSTPGIVVGAPGIRVERFSGNTSGSISFLKKVIFTRL